MENPFLEESMMQTLNLAASVLATVGIIHILQHELPARKPTKILKRFKYFGLRVTLTLLASVQMISLLEPSYIHTAESLLIFAGSVLLHKNTLRNDHNGLQKNNQEVKK